MKPDALQHGRKDRLNVDGVLKCLNQRRGTKPFALMNAVSYILEREFNMIKHLWDISDAGCWGDGALGHKHVRHKLADLVLECGKVDLYHELMGEPSDDLGEEDEALDILNDRTYNAVWCFREGDLLLLSKEEVENDNSGLY